MQQLRKRFVLFETIVHFNKATWDQYGPEWLSAAKKENLKATIYGIELSDEDQMKIKSFGFDYKEFSNKEYRLKDIDSSCLLTRFNILPKKFKQKQDDEVICNLTSKSVFDIVSCVSNLEDRSNLINLFQEKIFSKYNGFLSSDLIFASADFWKEFSSFQNNIISLEAEEKPYLGDNHGDDLFLNLYFCFFENFKVKVES